ncbi:phage tail protein I [Salmonella enterica subsp. enterica]|nr:phage tail protein I [Salmonella enterica subsp. enterica serovar Poona]
MVDVAQIKLLDVVPESLRVDPDVVAIAESIDKELQRVTAMCNLAMIYARIDELDSQTLDHLAWQYNADTWRDSWTVQLKRSVIKSIIKNKRKKGTRAAVEDAVSSLGSAVALTEWFEHDPPKEAHTFEVVSSINDFGGAVPTGEMLDDIVHRIDAVKPVRSHYTFSLAVNLAGGMGVAGGFNAISYARIIGTEQDLILNGNIGVLSRARPLIQVRLTGIEQNKQEQK